MLVGNIKRYDSTLSLKLNRLVRGSKKNSALAGILHKLAEGRKAALEGWIEKASDSASKRAYEEQLKIWIKLLDSLPNPAGVKEIDLRYWRKQYSGK